MKFLQLFVMNILESLNVIKATIIKQIILKTKFRSTPEVKEYELGMPINNKSYRILIASNAKEKTYQ